MTKNKNLRELEQIQQKLEYQNKQIRVFIADILPKNLDSRKNIQDRMIELENLVNTYGGVVIVKHIQNKSSPDYNTFIGENKLDLIVDEMHTEKANILILGNILKASQIYKINQKLKPIGAKAWDRIDLILKIFEKNALSRESKLQIELASIKHMGPRIFDMGMELGKRAGKGSGETNTEIMKRHLQKREISIKKELEHFSKVRQQHRQSRKKKFISTVGVVGYTNAGKSTLTNSLTKKGVLAQDKLFATLGTAVGKMFIDACYDEKTFEYIAPREILINDTIGFIRDLPPNLIEAFKSTLEDSIESDILLHVIDSCDPKLDEKLTVVDDILDNIGANQKRIYVFNKIDGLNKEKILKLKNKYLKLNGVFISSYKKIGLEKLKSIILKEL